jgi:sulfur dioxygenase
VQTFHRAFHLVAFVYADAVNCCCIAPGTSLAVRRGMTTASVLFRQLFDAESSTYTYLLADPETREAALFDPVREQVERDLVLLSELDLHLTLVLDTHTHADHVTAAGLLRERTGARTVGGRTSAPCTDLHVGDGDQLRVGSIPIGVLETPGHTDDSLSFVIPGAVLTGDSLLIRAAGRTDFQNGDAAALFDSITDKLFTLPDETLVYPGHDYRGLTVTSIGEEKRHNARIANRSKEEFIAVMNELRLPEPRRIREAVPANRACGVTAPPAAVQG